jgi:hypothetical protein
MNQVTDTFRHISSIMAWGYVFGCKHTVWSLRIGGDIEIREMTSQRTNMTNFENNYPAWIECVIYLDGCEHAIANIIDISQSCHILTVVWTILYDEPKPLK